MPLIVGCMSLGWVTASKPNRLCRSLWAACLLGGSQPLNPIGYAAHRGLHVHVQLLPPCIIPLPTFPPFSRHVEIVPLSTGCLGACPYQRAWSPPPCVPSRPSPPFTPSVGMWRLCRSAPAASAHAHTARQSMRVATWAATIPARWWNACGQRRLTQRCGEAGVCGK
eukprot:250841-Chlamydomonas_euryale.AAC.1